MKQLIICVALLSIVFSGIAFADEQQKQKESTIVGPVMQNRYVSAADLEKDQQALSETSQKLMDQGVIQAAEEARTRDAVQQPKKK